MKIRVNSLHTSNLLSVPYIFLLEDCTDVNNLEYNSLSKCYYWQLEFNQGKSNYNCNQITILIDPFNSLNQLKNISR